jgi:PAP2 superfamily.
MPDGGVVGVVSDLTYRAIVGTALLEPLVGKEKKPDRALWRLGGVCAGLLASSLDKRPLPETRPNRSNDDSFPSGHSAVTLAVSEIAAVEEPQKAGLWYGAAALETTLRAISRKHFAHDVVAGCAIGYFIARAAISGIARAHR